MTATMTVPDVQPLAGSDAQATRETERARLQELLTKTEGILALGDNEVGEVLTESPSEVIEGLLSGRVPVSLDPRGRRRAAEHVRGVIEGQLARLDLEDVIAEAVEPQARLNTTLSALLSQARRLRASIGEAEACSVVVGELLERHAAALDVCRRSKVSLSDDLSQRRFDGSRAGLARWLGQLLDAWIIQASQVGIPAEDGRS